MTRIDESGVVLVNHVKGDVEVDAWDGLVEKEDVLSGVDLVPSRDSRGSRHKDL